jgi:nucleoside-triphosphatase THEP1
MGKSTLCRQVAQAARESGLDVAGVVGIDRSGAGVVSRWQVDLRSGERILLGRMAPPGAVALGAPRWQLDEAALERCSGILTEACPADLLVIDEVGPLELEQGAGMLAGVRHALAGSYGVALVVVRPWLVARFTQLFPAPPPEVVDIRLPGALGRLSAAVVVREAV